jgi:hypothetical protein
MNYRDLLPKWTSIIAWIIGFLLFCGWSDLVWGQTYNVGDTIDNFGTNICENGEGYWDYDIDGSHNIIWLNLFTSW